MTEKSPIDPLDDEGEEYQSPAKKARESTRTREAAEEALRRFHSKKSGLDYMSDPFMDDDLPDFDDVLSSGGFTARVVKDEFARGGSESAVKMAFIGAGQGGGRIAQAFYDFGYRRVCVCNTTLQDMKALTIPNKLVIGNNRGGAGKDPEEGRLAAKESAEDIMDMMMQSFGEGVDHVYICVGAGGGSGTGSWPLLLDLAREYAKGTNIEQPYNKHLGLIMSLPKRSEGSRVQRNAYVTIMEALRCLNSGELSSLIIVDNAKIHELYPGLSVKRFWPAANKNFAKVLHMFNLLAARDSEYHTFDRTDFRSVVQNGLMIFGMARVEQWQGKEDISKAVRRNIKGTLLADGFDLSKANMAGVIVVAHDEILSEIPMENIDYAFNSMGRALGNDNITLHNGIYESTGKPTMRVFTIVSGLEPPEERLLELKQLAR